MVVDTICRAELSGRKRLLSSVRCARLMRRPDILCKLRGWLVSILPLIVIRAFVLLLSSIKASWWVGLCGLLARVSLAGARQRRFWARWLLTVKRFCEITSMASNVSLEFTKRRFSHANLSNL